LNSAASDVAAVSPSPKPQTAAPKRTDAPASSTPTSDNAVVNTKIDTIQMTNAQQAADEETAAALSAEEAQFQYLEYLVGEFQHMQGDLQKMYRLIEEVSERESAQEKIFNTLHSELRDYKNDFIYEHLKPVVRPLLFLYDSLE